MEFSKMSLNHSCHKRNAHFQMFDRNVSYQINNTPPHSIINFFVRKLELLYFPADSLLKVELGCKFQQNSGRIPHYSRIFAILDSNLINVHG